jgi:colanic acid/amylovoran biosynthesis glycosyltransferase
LQEAQACGLPVIATRHDAFPEGIASANATSFVPERNIEELAAKLHEIIASHPKWPAIGRAGREFVERRYDIRDLNQQLVQIYRKAMAAFKK